MTKAVKITVKCPKCGSLSSIPIVEQEVGSRKHGACPRCGKIFTIAIPTSLASKFVSDPTIGALDNDVSLFLEVVKDSNTSFQTFELTSDYYTIGRKNNSGPASRPDIEVITTDMHMSRKHAVIKKRGKVGFTINDLGSKNGIVVNEQKIGSDEEIYLNDGDTFCLGQTKFRVSMSQKIDNDDDLTR